MQDTEAFQFDLLNDLFGNHAIFQTIGDINQDIYGNYDSIIQQFPASSNFSITTCSRFPHHIAKFVQKVGVESQNITGEVSQNPILPHIIVYDNGSIHRVKDKFGEIIIDKNLNTIKNPVFKAIGSRKNDGKINIVSYFPDFNKQDQKVKEHYPALVDYTIKLLIIRNIASNIKILKGVITSIFVEALRLNSLKNESTDRLFTAQSLEHYLKFTDLDFYKSYRLSISKWIKKVLEGEDITQDIKDFLLNSLLVQFSSTPNAELANFINSSATIQNIAQKEKHNVYQASSGDQTVEIIFDTVHGVKGETHTATLYMETFNKCFDLQKILPLLSGSINRTPSFININKGRMKMAYVAMSRPTHLLCLAVHKDRINLSVNWAEQGVIIVEV